ncbi:hypothetical protein [Methylobacterium nodulans]|uniref:Uncharacterized protein n=1 Tax=Methylobacterium nodulans (strain LMG 21967 / CNCM I-2342 / ORS 2060) TaxID=460265 RepID=B8IVK0_METNO|nr:hypothetical protein [Methylobacterium nodulans]ACL62440.1 hypothetical protein Mnod_8294 [Methylobacterium nodulans ORS 2060]
MRFRRVPRPEPYRETSCKRAAFLRKQRLELEALPLFADAIAASQHDVAAEMACRAVWWAEAERERRRQRTAGWRQARARLFALDTALRRTIRALWRTCRYPGDPPYLAGLLHQIAVGRFDPHRPPWLFHPATFDAAFRRIGRRTVGGGPKTAPANELVFRGNLGAGILFLTSRVRLIDRRRQIAPIHASQRLPAPAEDPDPGAGRRPGFLRLASGEGPGSRKDLHRRPRTDVANY